MTVIYKPRGEGANQGQIYSHFKVASSKENNLPTKFPQNVFEMTLAIFSNLGETKLCLESCNPLCSLRSGCSQGSAKQVNKVLSIFRLRDVQLATSDHDPCDAVPCTLSRLRQELHVYPPSLALLTLPLQRTPRIQLRSPHSVRNVDRSERR